MLKLISLNIEGDNHIDKPERFMSFFKNEAPDVLCLQEVFEDDLSRIVAETGMTLAGFWPMCVRDSWLVENGPKDKTLGVAIFSRKPFETARGDYYLGTADAIPQFKKADDVYNEPNTINLVLGRADIMFEGTHFTVATTHFTWTPEGSVTAYQLEHLKLLLGAVAQHSEIVLCGDFNAPRGEETWNKIAAKYTDNIPNSYTTSLDRILHKTKGTKQYVVDGLFTTPKYRAENVRLVDGVSDHMAIVADIYANT